MHGASSSACNHPVQFLLARGVDANAKDEDGHTPLGDAEEKAGTVELTKARSDVAALLRQHGAHE